jgi:hypothetical protein
MANLAQAAPGRRGNLWVTAAWMTAAVLILLTPLAMMQVSDGWDWDAPDFVFAAIMLFGAGGAYEAVSRLGGFAYRAATGLAVLTAFILIWVNAAVGIIGGENNPANLMYGGVLLVGVIGAVFARFGARGMSFTLFAMAGAQAAAAAIAIIAGLGLPETGALALLAINLFFCLLWILAGGLYRMAALGQAFARLAP